MTKQQQRKLARDNRNQLRDIERMDLSERIFNQVIDTSAYKSSSCVLSYSSIVSEVDTTLLNQQILLDGKSLYLPRTDTVNHKMDFYRVTDLTTLLPGYQGILEPCEEACRYEETSSCLMVVPGLAFDKRCYRMGYGGGYYDRYLEAYYHGFTMQIAFSIQEQDCIQIDSHDQKMDCVITESGIYK